MAAPAARMLALAFDPSVHTAQDAISERILDAALELAAASGLRHLTMDDVAKRGRVGRMTVYRRFGSREALIEALTVRECRRCLGTIQDALDAEAPLIERLASLFTATLRVIREHPLLERLARVEPEALVWELTRDGSAVLALLHDFLVALVTEGQRSGELIDADPELLAELGVRLGASFVLLPDTVLALDDDASTRSSLQRLLAPLLLQ